MSINGAEYNTSYWIERKGRNTEEWRTVQPRQSSPIDPYCLFPSAPTSSPAGWLPICFAANATDSSSFLLTRCLLFLSIHREFTARFLPRSFAIYAFSCNHRDTCPFLLRNLDTFPPTVLAFFHVIAATQNLLIFKTRAPTVAYNRLLTIAIVLHYCETQVSSILEKF